MLKQKGYPHYHKKQLSSLAIEMLTTVKREGVEDSICSRGIGTMKTARPITLSIEYVEVSSS